MTNFKQYFRMHLKSNLRPMIYIAATVLVMTLVIGINNQPTYRYVAGLKTTVTDYKSTLLTSVVFLCILTYVIPVMEFSFFKKRINLDCAYSLPISRRAMGTVHYITGLITLLGTFTASYLLNFFLLLSRGPGVFDFAPMIAHYFLSILLGFAIYSIHVFVFNEANTKGDGIWFMLLYTFAFVLTFSALAKVFDFRIKNSGGSVPFIFISEMTTNYQYLVEIDYATKADFWQSSGYVFWFITWVVLGVAASVGFFLTFGKRRMEKTEEISDTYFGFRVLIPLYAITGMISFNVSDSVILWVIIELLALLGYTIYRRGFHYKKSDVAILCMLLIFLFV